MTAQTDPDLLADLEEERRFLLDSLRDLDREREAGDVDPDDYETLRDGYTVRAAAVLRSIEDHRARTAELPPRSRRVTLLVALAVVVVAVGIGVLVARSSGQRLPGQEVSGGPAGDGVSAVLVDARNALGSGELALAADLYRSVLDQDPDHPEALAYNGWLTVLVSRDASSEMDAAGLAGGKEQLRASVEADPDYADPHCFLAVIAAEYEDDAAAARREGRACLDRDPPTQMRGLVRQFVADL